MGIANEIYKTCILPILDDADFLMDSGNSYDNDKLDSIQRRCLNEIDVYYHIGANIEGFMDFYGITNLVERWKTASLVNNILACSSQEIFR